MKAGAGGGVTQHGVLHFFSTCIGFGKQLRGYLSGSGSRIAHFQGCQDTPLDVLLVRKLAETLDDDPHQRCGQVGIGNSGRIYRRDDLLASPAQSLEAVIPLPNFNVQLLAENIPLVTYDSEVRLNGLVERARRSSIWIRSPGGWVLRFHQGTPIPADL